MHKTQYGKKRIQEFKHIQADSSPEFEQLLNSSSQNGYELVSHNTTANRHGELFDAVMVKWVCVDDNDNPLCEDESLAKYVTQEWGF